MVESHSVKKPAAKRAVKHSKKYWRKGTDVGEFEESIHQIAAQKKTVGVVSELADSDLFSVDRNPSEPELNKKFTRRQQAALDKITKSISDAEPVTLPEPKFPQKASRRKRKSEISNVITVEKSKALKTYDLWDTDFTPTVKLSDKKAGDHYLNYTKKKVPNAPVTLKKKKSLLKAVTIPDAGASYNPTAEDYERYVSEIAKDEEKVIKEEEKIIRGTKPQSESFVTYKERELEHAEGLPIHPNYESDEDVDETSATEEQEEKNADEDVVLNKPKTKKQRETIKRIQKEERIRLQKKSAEKHQHDIFKTKKILKEIEEEDKEKDKLNLEKTRKKLLRKYTERQKLGRGKFEDEEAPFLLQEELPDSLRKLKPQGNVLTDRMKSMQKRNLLPIGGPRNKRKLKKSLKVKVVESRAAKEIKKGTKLI